jgi:parallel beta-helix repeat protein
MRGFLKFDISSIPAGATITGAKLRLHCYYITDYIKNVSDVQIREVTDDSWVETSINWNNQPAYGSVCSNIILLDNYSWAGSNPVDNWYENDVTSFVKNQFDNGDATISLMIRCMQEYYDNLSYRGSYYHSKEAALENRPTLVITYEPPLEHDLTSHAPIYINGNAGFTKQDPVNGGGYGTESDPYIIENWDISAENANGIWIENTTAYFIIRNCYVHSGSNYNDGIYFDNAINGIVHNNIVVQNLIGIHLENSDNNRIQNNIVDNNSYGHYGVYLDSSENNLITGNILGNNGWTPVYLSYSDNNRISGNISENNNGPIYLYHSDNNLISGNTEQNNASGIYLSYSGNNLISSNVVRLGGPSSIRLQYSDNNLIENNIVENNYFGSGIGIGLAGSNNNLISGNIDENNSDGIDLYSSNNNLISGNIVENNPNMGIYLYLSVNNLVTNNMVENSYYGIWLGSSDNNLISGDTVENNNYGIHLDSYSDNNFIYHNNFVNKATQAYDNSTNYWDNGYPSGGNYWSDYTGVDENYGENQNIPGSDGIGDTPYNISGGSNRDRYPLMSPWHPLWTGTVTITLDNMYSATVDLNGDFGTGSNDLVAKFYTYGGGSYQDSTIVCSENIPGHVTLNKHVSRPGDNAIQRLDLVVTDSGGTALGTIMTWATSKTVTITRLRQINGLWPFASEGQRTTYVSEIRQINALWPFASQ